MWRRQATGVETADGRLWNAWTKRRDEIAFGELVRPHVRFALGFARRMGCTQEDAEDVVQRCLVLLARERGSRPIDVGLRPWFGRAVVLETRMLHRSAARRRRREQAQVRTEVVEGDALETRDEVEAALRLLPDAQREAILLRYLHDLEYREIAHALGASENACRLRVHKGIAAMRRRLGGREPAAALGALPLLGSGAEAAVVGSALGAGGVALLGGLAMKKLLVAVAVLLAGAATLYVSTDRRAPVGTRVAEESVATEPPAAPARRPAPVVEQKAQPAPAPPDARRRLIEAVAAAGGRLTAAEPTGKGPYAMEWSSDPAALGDRPITGVWPARDARMSELAPLLEEVGGIRVLLLPGVRVEDSDAVRLSLLPLEMLYLGRTGLTDAGLQQFTASGLVSWISLHNTAVTDAGMVHLAAMPRLRYADLHDTALSDAGLASLARATNLESLHVGETLVTDAGFEHLRDLRLRELVLDQAKITGSGLAHLDLSALERVSADEAGRVGDALPAALAGAHRLRELNLKETSVTDRGLAHLAGLETLRDLDLNGTRIRDAGLAHLAGLVALESLSLNETRVTDHGLRHLAGLAQLRVLRLRECRIGERGNLVVLRGLKRLELLDLDATRVGSDDVNHFVWLRRLRRLSLAGTRVDDGAVAHLARLTWLKRLDLPRRFPAAALERLRKALPECRVSTGG